MTDPAPAPITRIQHNVLAAAERRLLTWLCARLPAAMTPDMLTAIGVAGAGISLAGYALSNLGAGWLWLAIAGYFINWFGNSLDGSVARYRKIERPSFGYFIDHSVDGFATLMILAGIGASPYVRMDVALFVLAGYLLLAIHAFLSVKVMGEMKLSYLNAGPTELRLALIAVTLAMLAFGADGPDWLWRLGAFDLLFAIVAAVLTILFILQTLATGRRIDRIERGL